MAEALERRILYLVTELLAHALRIIGALNPARAIATRTLQPILDGANDLFIWIKRYLHVMDAPLPLVHRAVKRFNWPQCINSRRQTQSKKRRSDKQDGESFANLV